MEEDVQTQDAGTESFSGDTPEPEAQAEVQSAAPAAEPEPISPEWLDQIGVPPEPEPDRGRQDYPTRQRDLHAEQYAQQPQYQQAPRNTQEILEQFVQDPGGFIERAVQTRLEQERTNMLGPVAMQLQNIDQRTQAFVQAQAMREISQAKYSVDQGYRNVFSKDETYRSNRVVREMVDGTLRGMLEQAAMEANMGYPQKLAMFSNPKFYRTFLAAAKANAEVEGMAAAPAVPRGMRVEGATPPQQDDIAIEDLIDADTLEAARKAGPSFVEKLRRAAMETRKRGDYTHWSRG